MYILTDRRLVLHNAEWAEPSIFADFGDISNLNFSASTNWIDDSVIHVTLSDGSEIWFPVATWGGGDRQFFDALEKSWVSTAPDAVGPGP